MTNDNDNNDDTNATTTIAEQLAASCREGLERALRMVNLGQIKGILLIGTSDQQPRGTVIYAGAQPGPEGLLAAEFHLQMAKANFLGLTMHTMPKGAILGVVEGDATDGG